MGLAGGAFSWFALAAQVPIPIPFLQNFPLAFLPIRHRSGNRWTRFDRRVPLLESAERSKRAGGPRARGCLRGSRIRGCGPGGQRGNVAALHKLVLLPRPTARRESHAIPLRD